MHRPSAALTQGGPTRDPAVVDAGNVLAQAAELLTGQVAAVTEKAMTRVCTEVPYFNNPLLAPADLGTAAHTAVEIAVLSRSIPERFADSGTHAQLIGERRAREGVPLRSLLHAHDIASSVLWESMVERVEQEMPEQAALMARASTQFWRHAGRDVNLLTEAYGRASGETEQKSRRLHQALLKVVLRGGLDPIAASGLAASTGLPLHGRYAVVLLRGKGTASLTGATQAEGIQLSWCPQRRGVAGIALLGEHGPADLVRVLSQTSRVRGGVSPAVNGLHDLGRARELAEFALGTCTDEGEVVLLEDRLVRALAVSRPDLAGELADRVLGPVLLLDPRERTALLDTLAAWLDCDGSASQATERLYCHRNTVLNRLRRLERLTGRLLDRPRDVVDLTLALDAVRLGMSGTG